MIPQEHLEVIRRLQLISDSIPYDKQLIKRMDHTERLLQLRRAIHLITPYLPNDIAPLVKEINDPYNYRYPELVNTIRLLLNNVQEVV